MPPIPPRRHPVARLAAVASVTVALVAAACNTNVAPSPSPAATETRRPTPTSSPDRTATPRPTLSPLAPPGPSASPGADDAATYRAIEEAVIDLRGLDPRRDVEPRVLDEAALKERMKTSFEADNPPELIEGNEILYLALGLLERDASLGDLYVELLGSQVAGFYDPETEELYVVARSGGLGVSERVTFAHEFTHALQDQHFDLQSLGLDEIGFGDRSGGRLALVEGDATAVMTFWAQQALTPEEAIELLAQSLDPEQTAILERTPPILRESLTFPYDAGLQFVLNLYAGGGWAAVNDAYSDPPASTEQILHPEKYAAREEPIEVELPDDLATRLGPGWTVPYEDTFGEFQTQVWLRNALRRVGPGNEAAAGWGGDRFAALRGPDDAWALAMATRWDSPADASEFEEAARQALTSAGGPADVLPGEGDTVRWVVVGSDADVLSRIAGALGLAG